MSNEAKLGTVPIGNEGRDAVHVAIVPAQADEDLHSGAPVRINSSGKAEECPVDEAIGMVDPFRPQSIRKVPFGSWFWLCLYPKTITGLRHVWEHPSFPKTETSDSISPATSDVFQSSNWLSTYVKRHCPYWEDEPDFGYGEFLRNVKDKHRIYYYGSDCHGLYDVDDADELFRHLSIILGKRIDADYFESFTCSC